MSFPSLTRDRHGELLLGGAVLSEVAREAGTPAYVYDLDAMAAEARSLDLAFDGAPHLVAYALKANTAGPVVAALASAGCGGDVVSGGELEVALRCGMTPDRIVYSGVAKLDSEIERALTSGARGIAAIQIESVEEVARVEARAKALGRTARVSVRVNPSVTAETAHAHIATGHDTAKFGVPRDDVPRAVDAIAASSHLVLVGMATHVGSQLLTPKPYLESARVLFALVRALRGEGRLPSLEFVDGGGGFGIDYGGTPAESPAEFVRELRAEQRAHALGDLALYVEPGRSLVAPYGVLLARVIQSKVATAARWLMIDAGMNDLLRPALYQARHRIVPLEQEVPEGEAIPWRVVGPVCESSDDFGEHLLPREPPEAAAILDAGAYGYTMASRYNGRQVPVEVFVRGGSVVGRTRRESLEGWVEERVGAGGGAAARYDAPSPGVVRP
jgi:diaminopimelate decarboxylase